MTDLPQKCTDTMFVAFMGLQTVRHESILIWIGGKAYYTRYCLN